MSLHGKEREKKKTFAHFYFIDHCVTGIYTLLKGYPIIYSSSLFLFDFLSSAKKQNKILSTYIHTQAALTYIVIARQEHH